MPVPVDGMGRHRTSYDRTPHLREPIPGGRPLMDARSRLIESTPDMFDLDEYAALVGGRIRRLREAEGLTQMELLRQLRHPRGHRYSPGFLSRVERGFANPPLQAYVLLAQALGVEPGALLRPEPDADAPTQEELLLLGALRDADLSPARALALLIGEP